MNLKRTKKTKPLATSQRPSKHSPKQSDRLNRWRTSRGRRLLAWLAVVMAVLALLNPATAQNPSERPKTPSALNFSNVPTPSGVPNTPLNIEIPDGLSGGPDQWTSPEGLSSTIQVMLLLTVLSLAPAILLMTTCFVRIVVVLGLLRQAIGTQQLPPSQVITALALFISILIMTPVWKEVYEGAVKPYSNNEISLEQAWDSGVEPIREFMIAQIERTDNSDDVRLFLEYLPDPPDPDATGFGYKDVPIQVLLPAFMLSELKTAFLIGFQIYLPFLILDMVIAAVLVSMGMMMLPPVLISLPFKLLLFVLLDGWHLVVGMLLESFDVFL